MLYVVSLALKVILIMETDNMIMKCTALLRIYGNDTIYPQNSSAYQTFTNSYWSIQQASVSPYCIFKPLSTRDVSRVVLLSRLTQCPFAVKSGGHTSFAGGSSIKGGITVALEKLNRIELSSDKKVVSVGPGSLWWDVYTTLEKENLSVIGGRVSNPVLCLVTSVLLTSE